MKPQLSVEAQADLDDAFAWYGESSPQLADAFATEIPRVLRDIGEDPRQCGWLTRAYRRCQITRFPYGIVYQPGTPCIIVAIAHTSREPGYWRKRMN